jgi:hypothetical protein
MGALDYPSLARAEAPVRVGAQRDFDSTLPDPGLVRRVGSGQSIVANMAHAGEHEVVCWPGRSLLFAFMNVLPQIVHTSGMRGGLIRK